MADYFGLCAHAAIQQYQKLIAAADELWLRALIETAFTYGWRIGELKNLKVSQVDLLNRTIRLNPGETKNEEGRLVKMTHASLSCCRVVPLGRSLTNSS